MEELMELVAASFVRNGIECPISYTNRSCNDWPMSRPIEAVPSHNAALKAAALPEHNYRRVVPGDPSP
jgi:hypothetical protein